MTRHTIRTANDEPISETVIDAVSAATGTDPLELPPLYEVIDPDALDRLCRRDDRSPQTSLRVEFAVAGCEVSVDADGWIVVVPWRSDPEASTASTP